MMKVLEKIGQAGLAAASLAGVAAIGYLAYRGVMDILSTPNAVAEFCDVYQEGVMDGREDGLDEGYDMGFCDAAEGYEYQGPTDELALKYNSCDSASETDILDLFQDGEEELSDEDKGGFALKNAFHGTEATEAVFPGEPEGGDTDA